MIPDAYAPYLSKKSHLRIYRWEIPVISFCLGGDWRFRGCLCTALGKEKLHWCCAVCNATRFDNIEDLMIFRVLIFAMGCLVVDGIFSSLVEA